jgi:hypothetical protein
LWFASFYDFKKFTHFSHFRCIIYSKRCHTFILFFPLYLSIIKILK